MWLWTFQIDLWKETGASKQRYSWNHGFLEKKKKRGKKDAGMSSCGESIGALLYFTLWHKSLIIDVLRIKKPLTVLAWQFSCSRVLVALGCFVALVRDPLLLSTHPVGFVPWQWPDPAGGSNQSGNILDQQRRGKINKSPPNFCLTYWSEPWYSRAGEESRTLYAFIRRTPLKPPALHPPKPPHPHRFPHPRFKWSTGIIIRLWKVLCSSAPTSRRGWSVQLDPLTLRRTWKHET